MILEILLSSVTICLLLPSHNHGKTSLPTANARRSRNGGYGHVYVFSSKNH